MPWNHTHVLYFLDGRLADFATGSLPMLKRAWWQGYRSAYSDEGFAVRLRGINKGLLYSEGDRRLRIAVETAGPKTGIEWIVYTSEIKGWLPPHDAEPFSPEKVQQVKERVLAALKFLGIEYYVPE